MQNTFLKSLAAIALTITLSACGDATKVEAPTTDAMKPKVTEMAGEMMATKTKAVIVYADWCSSCKVLDPAVKKARSMGDVPGVEFVVLDYTDKDAGAFYAQAKAAGVESAVRAYQAGTIKTGQMLLVDVDDAKVIGKVTKEDAAPAILAKLKDAVAAS
jgi:thiol-disulfide isomerase/thioredoxin